MILGSWQVLVVGGAEVGIPVGLARHVHLKDGLKILEKGV